MVFCRAFNPLISNSSMRESKSWSGLVRVSQIVQSSSRSMVSLTVLRCFPFSIFSQYLTFSGLHVLQLLGGLGTPSPMQLGTPHILSGFSIAVFDSPSRCGWSWWSMGFAWHYHLCRFVFLVNISVRAANRLASVCMVLSCWFNASSFPKISSLSMRF
jgi:hypothetical protein